MIDLKESSSLDELAKLPYWNREEKLLHVEPAGESNMNLVLRMKTNQRSIILKQSKPYVRKYPQIPAPIERIAVEHRFLELMATDPVLSSFSPKIIQYDPQQHILITGDLGQGADYSWIYSGKRNVTSEEIHSLVSFLNRLHQLEVGDFPDNLSMRRLNHEHIFRFPFLEENGFNLDSIQPGLQEISLKYKTDRALKLILEKLGNRYLSKGNTLIHGDFYPGSWLEISGEIKVIDPEFGFLGDREFDLGVWLAHLDLGRQSEALKESILTSYSHPFDLDLVNAFRGVEIMRRLIGIAQLPVALRLNQKERLVDFAHELVLTWGK